MRAFVLAAALSCAWAARGGAAADAVSLGDLDRILPWAEFTTGPAEAKCRDAVARFPKGTGGDAERAAALNRLAVVLDARGKPAEAEPLLRTVLEISRKAAEKKTNSGFDYQAAENLIISLNNLSIVLDSLGKSAEAESLHREAVALRRRIGRADHPDVAHGLSNPSAVLDGEGDPGDAEHTYRQNLTTDRQRYPGDHAAVATSLHSLAFVLGFQGEVAESEALWREVLAMRKRLRPGDHPEVAATLCELALVLRSRGKPAEAEPLLRDSLAMRKRLFDGDHPEVAAGMNDLASVLASRNKADEAEALFRDALAMRKRLPFVQPPREFGGPRWGRPQGRRFFSGSPLDTATSSYDLASLLLARGKAAEAEPLLRDAYAIRRKYIPPHYAEITELLTALAVVAEAGGKFEQAEALHRDALALRRKRHHRAPHPDVAASLANLARTLLAQWKLEQAEPLLRQGVRMYAALIAEFANRAAEGDALTLRATFPPVRDAYLSLARARRLDAAAVLADVWAEKGAVARVVERRHLAARAAAAADSEGVVAELAGLRARRAELILAPAPAEPAEREKRDAELADLAARIAAGEAKIGPTAPDAARSKWLDGAGVADLQRLLPDDAVFVDLRAYGHTEYAPTGPSGRPTPSYTAFVVTKAGVAWVALGAAHPIDEVVGQWREAITTATGPAPHAAPADIPARVRQLVWEKVRREFPAAAKTVYLSPDLGLARLPWAALPGDRPGTVVLEEFEISLAPHGRFLLDRLTPTEKRAGAGRLLAVGGVAYDSLPAGVDPALPVGREPPPVAPGGAVKWVELKSASGEAAQVHRRASERKLDARLLSGADATATRVLEEMPKARYAHIATHGFFADGKLRGDLRVDPKLFERSGGERIGAGAQNPLVMSGLVFAGANLPGTPGRGILTGEALVDRDLSGLELAVLSACETGLGDLEGGEGVFGLQRAFHVAGARNVVASLWKVPDAATAALMGEFYRNLWERGLHPADALRQAQLAVYKADPKQFAEMARRGPGEGDTDFDKTAKIIAAAPESKAGKTPAYVWAAFVLSGTGRPPVIDWKRLAATIDAVPIPVFSGDKVTGSRTVTLAEFQALINRRPPDRFAVSNPEPKRHAAAALSALARLHKVAADPTASRQERLDALRVASDKLGEACSKVPNQTVNPILRQMRQALDAVVGDGT